MRMAILFIVSSFLLIHSFFSFIILDRPVAHLQTNVNSGSSGPFSVADTMEISHLRSQPSHKSGHPDERPMRDTNDKILTSDGILNHHLLPLLGGTPGEHEASIEYLPVHMHSEGTCVTFFVLRQPDAVDNILLLASDSFLSLLLDSCDSLVELRPKPDSSSFVLRAHVFRNERLGAATVADLAGRIRARVVDKDACVGEGFVSPDHLLVRSKVDPMEGEMATVNDLPSFAYEAANYVNRRASAGI